MSHSTPVGRSSSSTDDEKQEDSGKERTATPVSTGTSPDFHMENKAAEAGFGASSSTKMPPKSGGVPEPSPSRPAGGLPLDHPMHPSQFSGDRLELRPLLTLLGSFCIMFCSFGWINCIGVFQDYYLTHQLKGYSESTVSWIVSLELFFMFFGGPIVGKLFDNFGPRYLLLVGTFMHVFGLMMASLSTKYYQFILSQGICSPIGSSMLFFPAMTSCISWFLKRRALAFGVIAGGASLGGVIFPIVVSRLVPQIGFGWTMRICAFMILGLLAIGNLTVSCRLKPTKKPFVAYEFISPLREVPYALLALGSFFGALGLFVPISYVVVQAQTVGMSTNLQGYLVAILNAASFFGRTIPGHVADKIGRFNVMVIMCTFSVVCIFALWIPANSNAVVILFTALYGFGSGAYISIMPTLVAEITKDMSKLGVRNGTSFAIISFATLAGTPVAGALIKACHGKFWGLQVFAGLSLALGTVLIFCTRVALVGIRLQAKA